MLVLGRQENETVTLKTSDGPIVVTVILAQRGQVKLGFSAPPSVRIVRSEIAYRGPGHEINAAANPTPKA